MNAEFTAIIQTLIAEQGKDALVNYARCRAFLPDYTKSEFVKERRLLLKVVETGAAKEIDAAANLDICKKQQIRHLKEELFMAEDMAVDVVDMLAFVLRGDITRTKPEVAQPAPQKPQETLYNLSFNYRQSGPYKIAQLLWMAENGQITSDYFICPVGTSSWAPVTTIAKLKKLVEANEQAEQERLAEQALLEKQAERKRHEARRRAEEEDDEEEVFDEEDEDDEDEYDEDEDFEEEDEEEDFDDDEDEDDEDDFDDDEKGGGCFITTAVCGSFSKPDDCYELTLFRNFRDKWLCSQPDGKQLVKKYYNIAPKIVGTINKLPEQSSIYKSIWDDYLSKCLCLIENGNMNECKEMYIQMIKDLKNKYWEETNYER
jgi:hypothetical protein